MEQVIRLKGTTRIFENKVELGNVDPENVILLLLMVLPILAVLIIIGIGGTVEVENMFLIYVLLCRGGRFFIR